MTITNYKETKIMRKLTVNRPQKMPLPFSKGKIMIDGSECGIVKAGKSATIEIPDGRHDIQLIFSGVPPVNSNALTIEESDSDLEFDVKIIVPVKNEESYAELTKK